jgi:predicted transcriptional regulator
MTAQITLNLPDEVYHQAELLAQQSHRTVSEILVETLEKFLLPTAKPVSALSDSEVIAQTQLRLQPLQEQRLSELLDRQQSGKIAFVEERDELQALIHIYETRLLRQAQALNEAVRRGLLEPLKG